MTRLLLPILLIGIAAGIFVLYTNPQYQSVKALQAEASSYDDALTKSKELKEQLDKLSSRRNTFEPADVQKLEKILPDNVDNIRLVIDINNIAARHGLTLKNVQLGGVSDTAEKRNATAVGLSGSAIGSVELGFALSASYENMLAFLADVEHSLRVIDVEDLGFTVDSTKASTNEYTFKIRTYWLH